MDINKILNSDYLDILFEGRNKQYGSYELRKKYAKRMRNATIGGLSFVVLCIATPLIASMITPKDSNKPLTVTTTVTLAAPPPVDPTKPPPPPPPAEPPPPVKPTVKFTPPVIKKDEDVKEDEKPPEQTEMKNVTAGVKTEAGDVNGIDPGIVDKPGTGTGVVATPPPPQIFTYVGQMPEPSVNLESYLQKNLHYPQAAIENNIQGRVVLHFVVNETGVVSDITVVRGIGSGCDEEAVRVLKAMPPWKPGKQNGTAVKVYFNLPISFKLQ